MTTLKELLRGQKNSHLVIDESGLGMDGDLKIDNFIMQGEELTLKLKNGGNCYLDVVEYSQTGDIISITTPTCEVQIVDVNY